jgi:hypothetical protein
MADDKVKARALAEKAEQDRQAAQTEAYDKAAPRSMGTFKEKAPKPPAPAASKPMAKGGCVKRYADGGVTEGPNANIDDDTRTRAMAAIRRRMAGEDDEAPVAVKPRAAAKMLPPKARESAAPAPAPVRREVIKPSTEAAQKYPTAAERGAQMRQSMADAEAENVRKRNARAEEGKNSLSDMMSGLKRRFGTKAMREEEGMKKGGCAKAYAGGGSVKGAGIAQRGVRKCKVV